jgi:anti-sigma regulatory factor (Ser/Thr protein kinase)
MTYEQRSFEPEPSSVPAARGFVAEALGHIGATESESAWAALVTSELATNAVLHARTGFEVGVGANGQVTISVCDRDPRAPRPRAASPEGVGGRGILIVAATSDAWGVERRPIGKRVWCSTTRWSVA